MARTDQPVVINEPGFLFSETDLEEEINSSRKLVTRKEELLSIRASVDADISRAERIKRRIQETQAECPHPFQLVINDHNNDNFQCLVCGKRRNHQFGQ